jgi:signal transduction histidine kinase
MSLGVWWLYLLMNIGSGKMIYEPSYSKMLFSEGLTFLVILFFLSITTFILFLRHQKKTQEISAFFASLTHELKTPLASIRLQSDIIESKLASNNFEELPTYFNRLVEDTKNLEIQMEKVLQLSRMERGGSLTQEKIELCSWLERFTQSIPGFELILNFQKEEVLISGDSTALELVFNNMVENSKRHAKTNQAFLTLKTNSDHVQLTYIDQGIFNGDKKLLGKLFYRHNSPKGSGIGLYLCKKLLQKMGGNLKIQISDNNILNFHFLLKRVIP